MADAKKCDRCGEFYELHADMKFNGIDLTMLKDWLEMKGEKNVFTNTK